MGRRERLTPWADMVDPETTPSLTPWSRGLAIGLLAAALTALVMLLLRLEVLFLLSIGATGAMGAAMFFVGDARPAKNTSFARSRPFALAVASVVAVLLGIVWLASLNFTWRISREQALDRMKFGREMPLHRVLAGTLAELDEGDEAAAADILRKTRRVLDGSHPYAPIEKEVDSILSVDATPNPPDGSDAAGDAQGREE